MGKLTEAEAVQIWIKAMDHSQAVLAAEKADEDDMDKAFKTQQALEYARQQLRAMIGQHVESNHDR